MASINGIEAVELIASADPALALAVRRRGRLPVFERTAAQPHFVNGIRGVIFGDSSSGAGSYIRLDSADPALALAARQRGQRAVVVVDSTGAVVPSGPPSVGGIAIGAAGGAGTLYENFKLAAGDDFNSVPSRWTAAAPSGSYATNRVGRAVRRTTSSGSHAQTQIYMDPAFRGSRSESQTQLGYEPFEVVDGTLTITAETTPAPLKPYLPTTWTGGVGDGSNKPLLISGGLASWPSFAISASGDFVLEAKVKTPAGVARSWWPAFWTSTLTDWPDNGEIDLVEARKDASGNVTNNSVLHVSDTDGGADVANMVVTSRAVSMTRMVHYAIKKSGTTLTFYDDVAAEGTLASVGSYTNARVARLRGAHDVRIDFQSAPGWDSSTFNAADWPQEIQLNWWRCWTPSAAGDNVAMTDLGAVSTTPGGSWATTIPSVASLYGTTPDLEEVAGVFDNDDAPGAPTLTNLLPGGMSVDLTARTVSGTVPETEGGSVGVLLVGSYTSGTPAKRAVKRFNVAPAAQSTLFANHSPDEDEAVALTVAYTDFHSGNLGPHTYVVTKTAGGTDYTVSGNGTGEVTITGTATTDEETTLSIACTNGIGQTTTVVRTIAAPAVAASTSDSFTVTSSPPTNWTLRWVTSGSVWDGNHGGNGYCRITPATAARRALSFDNAGSESDIELLAKIRSSSNGTGGVTASFHGLAARGSGSAGTENGWYSRFTRDAGAGTMVFVGYYSAGTGTNPGQQAFAWSASTWYWMRFRLIGTSIRLRVWADGGAEPGTWLIDLTNANAAAAGWAGLNSAAASGDNDFDYFSFATGGATAV